MFIINAPFWFKAIWVIIKAFLDAKTVSKIKIYGSDYLKHFVKYIDVENLPEFLGGKC